RSLTKIKFKDRFLYDERWIGEHGIGRYAYEIQTRIKFNNTIKSKVKPTSPLDIFVTPWYLLFNSLIFITPGFNAPWFFAKRTIITIHDLNHIDIKGNDSVLKSLYYNLILKRACKKCIAIFTVSEFSKKRIVDWSGISPKKVVVAGNGVSKGFIPTGEKYLPGYKYFLCVSNRKEHKNEKRLIDAYCRLENKHDVKLLFTGNPTDEMIDYIKSNNAQENIIFTGYIDEADFPKYYRGSIALLMPSLYEGFGLPVIEAMACGVPVLASNTTALNELARGYAITVDPFSIGEITAGLNSLITDDVLREELVIKGLQRAKEYSWDNTVEIIIDEINKINY
ncbi:TPA: glycosyltransferase family 4 protein, partial [Klebsiella pneumoniae]